MRMKRYKWVAWIAIYALLSGDLLANTSTTTISRLKLDHPDLGYDGGAGLHTAVETMFTKIGDNMNSRYAEYTSQANSTTVTFEHNFGVALSELVIRLYTGTGSSKVRIANPTASGWTIAATPSFLTTKVNITTPSSGGPFTFSVLIVHGRGSTEKLDDLDDVDVTTSAPQDGQALVYDLNSSQWLPGASGDSSLKCQAITTPNLTLKSGYLILGDGSEIQVASDLTLNLTTILGSSPSNATAYYLYLDRDALPSSSILSNGRKVKVASTESHFSLQTTTPDNVLLTRYVPLCVIKSATTGTAWSGTGSAFATLATRRHDRPIVNVNPVVYSLTQQAVGSIGSSGQIVAGHILTSASFPTFTTNLSFYNLTNASDGSGNARALTNNGSTPFTATNLFGTSSAAASFNGTSQSLTSTSSFFNPGNGNSIAMGGWFKATSYTPAAQQYLLTQHNSGTDQGFGIYIDTTGDIHFFGTNTAASKDLDLAYRNPGLTNGTWHHFAWVYNFPTTTLKGYVDGVPVISGFLANQRAVTTPTFQVGAVNTTPTLWFAGSAEEVFFTTLALKDEDVRRTYAYRVDHNQNVTVGNQDWKAIFSGNLANQMNPDWIVHMNANSVFWDFSELQSTDQVAITMANKSFTTTVVPINTYTTGKLTAAPSFPLTHGLGTTPKDFYVLTTGQSSSGQDDKRYDLCSVTSTQITCDLSSLTIDSSHQVEIVASAAPIALSVPSATATIPGIVSASTQTFGGGKTIQGNANEITLKAVANSGQSASIVDFEDSTGAVSKLTLSPAGQLNLISTANQSIKLDQSSNASITGPIYSHYGSTTATDGGILEIFRRSRNSTIGSQTATPSGDLISKKIWQGSDGTNFKDAATLEAWVDNTVSTNVMPGRIVMNTTNSSGSSVEGFRLDSKGTITHAANPSIHVTLLTSTAQKNSGVTISPVIFDSSNYDVGGNYNTGTGLFTAPSAGKYLVTAQVAVQEQNGGQFQDCQMLLLKNGGAVARLFRNNLVHNASGFGDISIGGTGVVNASASDTISISMVCDTASVTTNSWRLVGDGGENFMFINKIQ